MLPLSWFRASSCFMAEVGVEERETNFAISAITLQNAVLWRQPYRIGWRRKADNGEGSRKRVCIADAKSAIRWYKQNAEKLGIDAQRIIAGGGSAGGHVSLLATTNPELNDSHDNREYDTSVVAYLLFNPALGMADAKDSEVDFLQHIRPDFPPAIVFFGSEDEKWLKGWNAAYTKMQSLDIRSVELWIAEAQEHSFFNKQPWQDMTIRASDEFLKALGLIKGEPTLMLPKTPEKLVKKSS